MRRLWSSNISIIISAKANLRVALFPQINSGEEGYFPIFPPDGADFCRRRKIASVTGCRSSLRGKVDTEKINLSHSKKVAEIDSYIIAQELEV